MGGFIYHFIIFSYRVIVTFFAPFNSKANLLLAGKKNWKSKLTSNMNAVEGKRIWFHCASLGEFEQGRPVIEAVKKKFPEKHIILTFFSPTGYQHVQDYDKADVITYLPWDTRWNALNFYNIVKPDLVCFIKYEFWYHFLNEGHRRGIPVLLISGIFRNNQLFFRWYGTFYKKLLGFFEHIFVQNKSSQKLLESLGFQNVTVAGDTRIDRVIQYASKAPEVPLIKRFKGPGKMLIVGSAWKEDLDVVTPVINDESVEVKFIVVPHEIDNSKIQKFRNSLTYNSALYSEYRDLENPDFDGIKVLIIDNVGMLAMLYQYADFAFIGGAYSDGLHNILEPAVYGMPIFFGDTYYDKFQEALDLIEYGSAFPINDSDNLKQKLLQFLGDTTIYEKISQQTEKYIEESTGATEKIMDYLTANNHS